MSRLGIKSATSDYPVWNILVCHGWGSNLLHLITQSGTYRYVTAGDQISYISLPSVEHINQGLIVKIFILKVLSTVMILSFQMDRSGQTV